MSIIIYKNKGITPLECINQYKIKNNIKDKVCFAGRLDPMAHGKLICLVGEECKEVKSYCNLNKTYEFIVLFGFRTDTFDLLGKVIEFNLDKIDKIDKIDINKYRGKMTQYYPPYSSFIVKHNGVRKPLWEWSKLGKIKDILIPHKEVEIFEIEEIKYNNDINNLGKYINENINLLSDLNKEKFRVPEILNSWNDILKDDNLKPIIKKFRAKVSSGTYIRSLVEKIGKDLGCGALTLDIERTNIYL